MPTEDKIIRTTAVLGNPMIEGKTQEIATFSIDSRIADTDRYWKVVDIPERRRKIFPLEYWELENLLKKNDKVALIIQRVSDPDKMTGKWISFSDEKPPVLKGDSICFVIEKDFLYSRSLIEGESYKIRGLANVQTHGMKSNFLVGLVGKDIAGKPNLYLCNAYLKLIEKDPKRNDTSPGGETIGGVKLP